MGATGQQFLTILEHIWMDGILKWFTSTSMESGKSCGWEKVNEKN